MRRPDCAPGKHELASHRAPRDAPAPARGQMRQADPGCYSPLGGRGYEQTLASPLHIGSGHLRVACHIRRGKAGRRSCSGQFAPSAAFARVNIV